MKSSLFFFLIKRKNIILKNLEEEERSFDESSKGQQLTFLALPKYLFFSLVYPLSFSIFSFFFSKKKKVSKQFFPLFYDEKKIYRIFVSYCFLRLSYDVKVASLINQRKYEFLEPVTSALHNYLSIDLCRDDFLRNRFSKNASTLRISNLYNIFQLLPGTYNRFFKNSNLDKFATKRRQTYRSKEACKDNRNDTREIENRNFLFGWREVFATSTVLQSLELLRVLSFFAWCRSGCGVKRAVQLE